MYQFHVAGDGEGNMFSLYGVDDTGTRFFDRNKLEINTLYSASLQGATTALQIPVVEIEEGGYVSRELMVITLANDSSIPAKTPFALYEPASDQAFISFDTYKAIIEQNLKISWDVFVKRSDAEEDFGFRAIYKRSLNNEQQPASG